MPEYLGKDTSRRLLNMLRWWEKEPRNIVQQAKGPLRSGGGGGAAQVAKTTTGVTSGSLSAPGTGTVQPLIWSGSTYNTNGGTITALNLTDSTIATGALVIVIQIGSQWWIDVVDSCSHIS